MSHEFQQELRRRGVSLAVWRVLSSLIGAAQGETVSGLARACLLQQPTMTKLLDRMTRDGLVRRRTDGRDRRVVRVELTAAGQAKAKDLMAAAKRHESLVLGHYSEYEADAVKTVLRAMIARHERPPRRGAAARS